LDPSDVHEPEVDLVDEGGGLEQMARPLARHVPPGEAAQLVVHEGQQLAHGALVAAPPP
jgi:hypothetical protein